jgi:hypothetical protein
MSNETEEAVWYAKQAMRPDTMEQLRTIAAHDDRSLLATCSVVMIEAMKSRGLLPSKPIPPEPEGESG